MIGNVRVIVLTPVKNEDWILDNFLQTTSLFADHIIVADQKSTDGTELILKKYPKVIYIKNENDEYDEDYRQNLLINKARELFDGEKLLIALDADEIITADSIDSLEWNAICNQLPGTQILFKKLDVLPKLTKFYDSEDYFLLGYIDDGKKHIGSKFHSNRVPLSDKQYYANSVKFMHLALVRTLEYNARQRLYTILENLDNASSLRFRYRKYSKLIQQQRYKSLISELPLYWLEAYEKNGMNLREFQTSEVNKYNERILECFKYHGTYRFWMDDIWYVDYVVINKDLNNIIDKIIYPNFLFNIFRKILIYIYYSILKIKN